MNPLSLLDRSNSSIGKSKEDGFTLLEVTLALSVVSLCILFLSLAVTQIKTVRATIKDDRQIEWHIFLNQLENDMADTLFVEASPSKVTFSKPDNKTDKVSYSHFEEMIRRQVGSKGHQPMLLEVDTFEFKQYENELELTVVFNNGEEYRAFIKVNKETD